MNDLIFHNFGTMGFEPSARNQIIIDLTFKELQHDYSGLIKFLNPSNRPFDQLHFWGWLARGGFDDHSIVCKRRYLESLGFVVGQDFIDQDALDTLKATLEIYFYWKIRPLRGEFRTYDRGGL